MGAPFPAKASHQKALWRGPWSVAPGLNYLAVDPIDDNSDAACTSDEQIAPSVLNSQVTAAMEQLPRGPS
ncbi:hypothetical protein VTN96DRAFT_1008 [Rasamsonia emersonii]